MSEAAHTAPARIPAGRGLLALSPIAVFLALYLAVSIIIDDFYKIPLAVALLAASVWAVAIFRGRPLAERIEVFSREAGNHNVLYMIWIFILAGAFATLARGIGAVEATVNLCMGCLPPQLVIPGLFAAACFISMSIGTSVGTIVALTPLAVSFAESVGGDLPFFVAVVLGGAFFGDNLSFISDTTIAATRTQGCLMNEKFKANLLIALPAALITLAIYMAGDFPVEAPDDLPAVNPWLVLPYITVIALALLGVNVTVTLLSGLALAIVMALGLGHGLFDIMATLGSGIDSMGNLIIITLLATGMLGVIKASGGIDYLMQALTSRITGARGAQGAIAALVAMANVCTANNTVAILTVGSISRRIASTYGVTPRKSASLLDTASCIVQCLIPYGAQTLMATALAGISPTAPFKYLFYPWVLLLTLFISILVKRTKI